MSSAPLGEKPQRQHGDIAIRVSAGGLALLALLLVLPWAVLVWWRWEDRPARQTGTMPTNSVAHSDERTHRCRPGPWGELEYTRILIEPPFEFVPTRFDLWPPVRWVLPAATPEALGLLLATVPLTAEQRRELLAPGRAERAGDSLIVKPSQELILGLSPTTRAALYAVLGANPANTAQHRPSRIRAKAVAEWLADSGLAPATVELVEKCVYRRGNALLFADQATVLPLLPADAERTRLIKTLARKAALHVSLRVRPTTDIDELVRYWSPATRAKDIEPLLRSVPQRPEGFLLDVVHLLPRFARARLYTYPEPRADADTLYRDCHWTSLNFFATTPNDRFGEAKVVGEVLARDYYRVLGDPVFGDIVVFTQADGSVKHSCVYVADDIVFTKNGGDPDVPWILMQLADLLPWYAAEEPVTFRAYRRRSE